MCFCGDQVNWEGGTWKRGNRRSVHFWYIGWQNSGGRTRGGIIARRGLSCRGVPICQQGGRPASCKRLCSVWPFPQSQRILGEWRWTAQLWECLLFLGLMFPVAFRNGGVFVGGCMRVEYSYIEEGSLKSTSPEIVDCNIESCPITCVGGGSG